MLVRIADAHLHILARKVVQTGCVGCFGAAPGPFHVRLPFSVAGLQPGYVVVSPLHLNPNRGGQVVEIPVTLNGG